MSEGVDCVWSMEFESWRGRETLNGDGGSGWSLNCMAWDVEEVETTTDDGLCRHDLMLVPGQMMGQRTATAAGGMGYSTAGSFKKIRHPRVTLSMNSLT